ncbi:OmpA family protein [Geomobilimonas luticola]|uniref:OmpA family protein n=1 Tax=Geomobilimonas luticola TaxID=1114878 RepID=A0ABS5SHX0_9BACT|nr:OmpA family protein [Geomobilimonas luticola]MBT0653742.1 OmpA family protein [Geomobilimonas luticola]
MLKKSLLLVLFLVIAVSQWGCVSLGRFEQKEQEAQTLDKNLQELQKKYQELGSENDGLKARVAKLTGEAEGLVKEKEKLAADNRALDKVLKSSQSESLGTIVELRQKIADLERENARLRDDVSRLQKAKEEEVQKTSKTYEELLEKMKGEISKGEVTISELKGKLTVNMLNEILFDSGKAEVKAEGLEVLQKVVDILKTVQDKAIRIEGHTDNNQIVGALTKKYATNWELSAARAINVARFLQQQGIDPTLLGAVAYGEYKPVASNDTPEGKAKNRRIEIILVPKD